MSRKKWFFKFQKSKKTLEPQNFNFAFYTREYIVSEVRKQGAWQDEGGTMVTNISRFGEKAMHLCRGAFAFAFLLYLQSVAGYTVSGTVYDSSANTALGGVVVQQKGTANTVITGASGAFILTIGGSAIINARRPLTTQKSARAGSMRIIAMNGSCIFSHELNGVSFTLPRTANGLYLLEIEQNGIRQVARALAIDKCVTFGGQALLNFAPGFAGARGPGLARALAAGDTLEFMKSGYGGKELAVAQGDTNLIVKLAVSSIEKPGLSAELYATPHCYICVHNFYVAANGDDGNDGSEAHPWKTIQHADNASRQAGDCINVGPGTYIGGFSITHGGNAPSKTGYVVYRSSTIGGARILGGYYHIVQVGIGANYLVFEGFEFDGNNNATPGAGLDVENQGTTNNGISAHHIWAINNVFHSCGMSGIQFNNAEYHYAIHNVCHDNSNASCSAQGSGISFCVTTAVPGLTPTGDDLKYAPFHNVISYNVTYNNTLTHANCPGSYHTDGNGIIIDCNNQPGTGVTPFAYRTLVSNNIAYGNGSGGVHVFNSSHVTVANNTAYNNFLDSENTGTWRGGIDAATGSDNLMINNISVAISGSGVFAYNSPYLSAGTKNSGNVWANNISFGGAANVMGEGDVFPASSNKISVDPKLVNMAGGNFALQAGSPAIGYGQTQSYLPPQSIDIGACPSGCTVCP